MGSDPPATALTTISTPITEQTSQALTSISEELQRLKLAWSRPDMATIIAESVPAMIVDLDSGMIVKAMPLIDSMFGYLEGELNGKHINTLIPERFHAEHDQYFEGYRQHPTTRVMGTASQKLFGMRQNGEQFPVEVSLYPKVIEGRRCVVAAILMVREKCQTTEETNHVQQ